MNLVALGGSASLFLAIPHALCVAFDVAFRQRAMYAALMWTLLYGFFAVRGAA